MFLSFKMRVTLSFEVLMKVVVCLMYTIQTMHIHTFTLFFFRNILVDKPNDQSSRWSSESNYPPQVGIFSTYWVEFFFYALGLIGRLTASHNNELDINFMSHLFFYHIFFLPVFNLENGKTSNRSEHHLW